MIPVGSYKARAQTGTFAESKAKGTAYVRVPFRIDDGEHKGTTVTWDGYFTENTTERTVEALRNCGCTFPGDNITDLTGLGSAEVEIVVEHEGWEDRDGNPRTRARVQWVNAPGGGIPEEQLMDERKRASFAAKMKGTVIVAKKKGEPVATAPVSGPKNGPAKKPAQREPGDDFDEFDSFAG